MFANFLLLITMIFAFAALIWQNMPYQSLINDKVLYAYDYIIVGGGTAGCVLANRLSEDPNLKVLLVEAGDEALSKDALKMPAMAAEHQRTSIDWSYTIEPQNAACQSFENKRIYWPRGKMLGGTDSFNYMVYTRGNPRDYDDWAAGGCKGWSYEDVLPYFIKSESNQNRFFGKSDYHGTDGPLIVSDMPVTSLADKFVLAGQELGFDHVDVNGQRQLGVAHTQATISWGSRRGVASAYLVPALNRDNLHVAIKALVTKILLRDNEAYGIELVWNNTVRQVRAKKEVILSAGTIESPHILMLSGIGPRRHLESHDIAVVKDLPVGLNLQDQIYVLGLEYTLQNKIATTEKKTKSLWTLFDYLIFGKGDLTSSGLEGTGFFRSIHQPLNMTAPLIQLHLSTMLMGSSMSEDRLRATRTRYNMNNKVFTALFGDMQYGEGFSIMPILLHPKSRGTLKIKSKNPEDPPLLDPNYLAHHDDVKILLEAIHLANRFITTKTFKAVGADPSKRIHPNCADHEKFSDHYWECFIRENTMTMNHAVGTCKMGDRGDNSAVVDPQLRVRGIQRLRVVDASIMPSLPSGNINAAVVMIAEKAADIILNRISIRKFGQKETHDEWHEKIHKRDEL